jgi:hypothetical protein
MFTSINRWYFAWRYISCSVFKEQLEKNIAAHRSDSSIIAHLAELVYCIYKPIYTKGANIARCLKQRIQIYHLPRRKTTLPKAIYPVLGCFDTALTRVSSLNLSISCFYVSLFDALSGRESHPESRGSL